MIRNKLIYLLISTLFILTAFILTLIYINKKVSSIIMCGPFTVEISNLQKKDAGNIKIFGCLLNNENIELTKSQSLNTYTFEKNNCITRLVINANNNFINDSTILCVFSKNKKISINEFHFDHANNSIDISNNIKIRATRAEFIRDFLHPEIIRYYLIIILLLILYFVNMVFVVYKYNVKDKIRIFSIAFILLALSIHILFYIFTGVYLVTSGIFLILVLWFITWFLTKLVQKILKKVKINKNFFLSISSIFSVLLLLEIILLISGYNSTSAETRSKYYYASKYSPSGKDWFHLWSFDHDLKTDEFCFHRTLNAERLSDVDHSIKKKHNVYRIIGVGDSFTEGDGTDVDSTWLKFLDRNLTKYPLKKQIEYINAGVCGSDPFFGYILLKEKLLKYKPDLVVLSINSSDIEDISIRGGMERFQNNGTLKYNSPQAFEPLFAICRISRLGYTAIGYNEVLIKYDERNKNYCKEKIIEAIEKFKELGLNNNFDFIVIFNPLKNDFYTKSMELSYVMNEVRTFKNINSFDMLAYYMNIEKIDSTNCSKYYWVNDGHHNAKGYEAFARGVEWKLKEIGIIDSLMKE